MPNILDATGLTTATEEELDTYYVTEFESIYGTSIDVESSSPDGQAIGILTQGVLDVEDLIAQTYAFSDPDEAVGVVLDMRVAINGIQRQPGSYTITPITITVSQPLNLYGLNQTTKPVFTVADSQGNEWQLITSQIIPAAGSYSYQFQAANPGAITTIQNTIQQGVSIVLGVTGINNPLTFSSLGVTEEIDGTLKIRRMASTQGPSQGFNAGCQSNLANVPGVTYAKVTDNFGGSTDQYGTPANSMWAIVGGNGSPAAIAQIIYANRSDGCGMRGAQSYAVTQPDTTQFVVNWDNVVTQNLFIKFTATSIDGINAPNLAAILAQLPALFTPAIGAVVNVSQLAGIIQSIDPNCLVTNAGFSTTLGGTYTNTLAPTSLNYQFQVNGANIFILPMTMLPLAATVPIGATQLFTAYGGTQTYTYSVVGGGVGGTINASTGLYTPPGSGAGVDNILATDGDGNTASATATVP